jgi:Tfp pilus assembly PilM family ATPase/Tfp pilus assembly protein PilN
MPRSITTLYIDDTSIKLMVTRGKRVSKLGDVPLDINLMNNDAEAKQNELVTKIKHLIKTNKISTKRIIVGISGLHCISRPAILPQLPKTMMDEAFLREARRVFPVPPEQLHISWQIISSTEGNMQAFLVAVPRQIADPILNALNQVGLKPYLMDVKPLALARLVKEPTAILIDVQATEFDIVVISDGIPQPIRTISLPQETTSISDKLLIVKDELKRTIQFYNSNNPDKQISPDTIVYVSGILADEPDIYEELALETGYQVSPLISPLKSLKQLDASHYLANVGLALKELPKESGALLPNINTLPEDYLPKQINVNRLMAIPVAAIAIGLVIVLALTIKGASASITTVQSQLDAAQFVIEKKQAQKKELNANIEDLQRRISGIESERDSYISAFNSIGQSSDAVNNDLLASVGEMVENLQLYNINHNGLGLSLTGRADSEQEVMKYVRNLQDTGRFGEITITNLSRIIVSDNETETSEMDFNLALLLSTNRGD